MIGSSDHNALQAQHPPTKKASVSSTGSPKRERTWTKNTKYLSAEHQCLTIAIRLCKAPITSRDVVVVAYKGLPTYRTRAFERLAALQEEQTFGALHLSNVFTSLREQLSNMLRNFSTNLLLTGSTRNSSFLDASLLQPVINVDSQQHDVCQNQDHDPLQTSTVLE